LLFGSNQSLFAVISQRPFSSSFSSSVAGFSEKYTHTHQPCGDFKALQPTVAAAVPLMMDRMRKGVLDRVGKSKLFNSIFHLAYRIKRRLCTYAGIQTTIRFQKPLCCGCDCELATCLFLLCFELDDDHNLGF
jgi:long-subunit acyl-CoA synthetase (AMP-forming)